MKAAIVATAWRTPLGTTLDEVMRRLHAGERAAIANPFADSYACKLVAPIRQAPAKSRNERFLRRMGLYGLEVAQEAFDSAGIAGGPRYGLFTGVGGLRAHWDDMLPALANQHDTGEDAWRRGLEDVHPYWMLRHLSNNAHALASAELGLRGDGATFGGATGGAQAIAAATRALHDDAIDAALVVAYDSLLEPETLVELGARGHTDDIVPGEAAAAIVLVREAVSPVAYVEAFAGRDDALAGIAEVDHAVGRAMGKLGAATAVVEAIALAAKLRYEGRARVASWVETSAPGLGAWMRVEVPA